MEQGLPFQLGDLWHDSALDAGPDDGTLFRIPDFNLEFLQEEKATEKPLIADLDFELPEIVAGDHEDDHDLAEHIEKSSDDQATDPLPQTPISDSDVWSLDLGQHSNIDTSESRTWEAFAKPSTFGNEVANYLSEAKPEAFDAALSLSGPCSGVLPQETSLRALWNLALGRSSIFFQWDPTKESFTQTLPDITTSSLSLPCHASFVSRLLQYGDTYRKLQVWAEARESLQSTPAVRALKQATLRILQAVETSIAVRFPVIRTILQLQQSISLPHQLLDHLDDLKELVSKCTTEEQAISQISGSVLEIVETGSLFADVLRLLVEEVCAPWLEELSIELGLSDGHLRDSHFRSTELSGIEDELEESFSGSAPIQSSTPALLDPDDHALIKDTKDSLRLVRLHLPGLRLRCPSLDAISTSAAPTTMPFAADTTQNHDPATDIDDIFATNEMSTIEAESAHPEAKDALRQAVDDALRIHFPGFAAPKTGVGIAIAQTAFAKLRPATAIQARYLNREILRHVFGTCGLKKHFELQHSFHLFGNGDFVIRLSTALFSPDTQAARRTRGTVPTGEVLGLRLGTRDGQPWPPASSELRLTLNEVLADSYRDLKPSRPGMPPELPGNLSFSIRELPDEEIDRVMDVSSIYALDFLRLQYTAPAPLNAIITATSLQRYDDIFRLLLKLLRVLDVTTRLRWEHLTDGRPISSRISRFAFAAHHFICNLMSTLMEVGVGETWREFRKAVERIERSTNFEHELDAAVEVGLSSLRQMHENCLEALRGRLFLKRRQAKARNALHDVLAAILQACSTLHDPARFGDWEFQRASSNAFGVLQAIIDKPPKHHDVQGYEVEIARLLLARLNFNNVTPHDS